jgi:hypothetical protein
MGSLRSCPFAQTLAASASQLVVGNACASLGSRSFNSSLSVVFGHEMLSPLLTNSFASGEFHKMGATRENRTQHKNRHS